MIDPREEIKRLADEYAHVYAFVGDDTMPKARAALYAAIDAMSQALCPLCDLPHKGPGHQHWKVASGLPEAAQKMLDAIDSTQAISTAGQWYKVHTAYSRLKRALYRSDEPESKGESQ